MLHKRKIVRFQHNSHASYRKIVRFQTHPHASYTKIVMFHHHSHSRTAQMLPPSRSSSAHDIHVPGRRRSLSQPLEGCFNSERSSSGSFAAEGLHGAKRPCTLVTPLRGRRKTNAGTRDSRQNSARGSFSREKHLQLRNSNGS